MLSARLRPVTGALTALALIVWGAPWNADQLVLAQTQSLFVSLSDAGGEPVTDLTPEDVVVRWDDVECETLDLEPIDWPVRVTVFVDNGPGGHAVLAHIREGLRLFVDELPEEVPVGLATISERVQFMTKHTTDREELLSGIGLTVPQHGPAVFLDALIEEAEDLADDKERQYFPVIVMVATTGPEASTQQRPRPFERMMQRLLETQATVHTRMYAPAAGSWFQPHGDQVRWGIDISQATGGSYDSLSTGIGFRTQLPQLGHLIARKHRLVSTQYRVTYAPPDNASDQPAVRVGTTRAGLTVMPTIDGNIFTPQDGPSGS